MADVLVNAPPVVQLEQLQPPSWGVVAGFSSEAELSQQQVELQEQHQQQLLLLRQQKGSCSSFGAFWCRLVFRGAKKQCPQVSQLIRELHTPGQSSFYLGVLCFSPCPRGEKRVKVWHGTACIDLVCEVKTAKNP